jgi:tetratricopeptide (TPR) repeat protein
VLSWLERAAGGDRVRCWLFAGAFAYAWALTQGLPLWDDDYKLWTTEQGVLSLLFDWLLPVSTEPDRWGFAERPVQKLVYKVCRAISGFDAWSYRLYKGLAFALLVTLVYVWVNRVSGRRAPALAAALFFGLLPNVMASLVWHADFATTAESVLCLLGLWLFNSVEATPEGWRGLPRAGDPAQARWLRRWFLIAFCVYLAYETKGDLRGVPITLGLYVLAVRPRQWTLFAMPIAVMLVLAIPWGRGVLSRVPPWFPGSSAEVTWMYQGAAFASVLDFIWSSDPTDFATSLTSTPLSAAGIMGPFGLAGLALAAAAAFRAGLIGREAFLLRSRANRMRLFVLAWCVVAFVLVSALPELNPFFRARYAVITMLPVTILAGSALGPLLALRERSPLVFTAAVLLCLAQVAVNAHRAIVYRAALGRVQIAIDDAYRYLDRWYPQHTLALMPSFASYAWRPDGAPVVRMRRPLEKLEDLRDFPPYDTLVLDWRGSLWEQLEVIEVFDGCRPGSIVDLVHACERTDKAVLMRHIGEDPDVTAGLQAMVADDLSAARRRFEAHLLRHPRNLGVLFQYGIVLSRTGDYAAMERVYALLERHLPGHAGVEYNHGIALELNGRYADAAQRFEALAERGLVDYGLLYHLFQTRSKLGDADGARAALRELAAKFPDDAEVRRLSAEHLR